MLGFVECLLSTGDLLGFADCLVRLPLIAKVVVVGQRTCRLFDAAFQNFRLTTHEGDSFFERLLENISPFIVVNFRDALMALVAWSRSGCGLLHGRLRGREARRDDRSGTRGLRATACGSRSAAGIRCDEARLLRLLAAVVRDLLVAAVAGLAAVVVTMVAVTAPGLGIGGAEDQSECRSEDTQGQQFSRHCKILLLRNTKHEARTGRDSCEERTSRH